MFVQVQIKGFMILIDTTGSVDERIANSLGVTWQRKK